MNNRWLIRRSIRLSDSGLHTRENMDDRSVLNIKIRCLHDILHSTFCHTRHVSRNITAEKRCGAVAVTCQLKSRRTNDFAWNTSGCTPSQFAEIWLKYFMRYTRGWQTLSVIKSRIVNTLELWTKRMLCRYTGGQKFEPINWKCLPYIKWN